MVAIGLIWSLKNRVPQRPHVNRKIQLRDQNQTDPTLDGSKIKEDQATTSEQIIQQKAY